MSSPATSEITEQRPKLRLEWRKASELADNPRNWRRHPQRQVEALDAVLRRVGWAGALLYNEATGRLIDGHARKKVRDAEEVPVLVGSWTEEEEATILATLDPLAAMAEPDIEQLEGLLLELRESSVADDEAIQRMIAGLAEDAGITLDPKPEGVDDPGPQIDRAAELQEKWQTASGQLWEVPSVTVPGGCHKILCGDSTRGEDVARLMGGERAALMATDPPYLVNYRGGNHPQSFANRQETRDKHWDDYVEGDGPAFFAAFIRVALAEALTENPAIYQWHASRRQALVEAAWKENGLLWHQTIVWVKSRGVLTHSHFMWQSEPCAYGWVQGNEIDQRPPANETNIWQIDQQGESDGIHPTQKPRELFLRPMNWHLPPGGLAFEPFSGSGTALVAAEQTGRRCYAIEMAPGYVAVALERLAGMGLQPAQVAARTSDGG